jgi:hypothetical protein
MKNPRSSKTKTAYTSVQILLFGLLLSFTSVHLHQSKKTNHQEVTKLQKSRFFFIFFLLMEVSGSVQNYYGLGGRPNNSDHHANLPNLEFLAFPTSVYL